MAQARMARAIPTIVSDTKSDYFNKAALLEAMRKDKKRVGQGLAVILMTEHYEMRRISDLSEEEFGTAHSELTERLLQKTESK